MSVVAYSDNITPNAEFTAFTSEARKKARSEWKKDDAARLDAPLDLLLAILHAEYQGSVAARPSANGDIFLQTTQRAYGWKAGRKPFGTARATNRI